MSLDISEPVSYKTACGKGYWIYKEGEPKISVLDNLGVAYFQFESASSIWYRVNSKDKFSQIWISD